MSFDQAILHHKTHRRPYRGAKAIDATCRNHGTCPCGAKAIVSISCYGPARHSWPASKNGGKPAGGARFVNQILRAKIF